MALSQVLRSLRPTTVKFARLFSEGSDTRIEKTINEVRLLGRAGAEAKKGGTETHPVVYFSVATSTNYKTADSDDLTQKVEWHRIVVFKPSLRETVYNYLKNSSMNTTAVRMGPIVHLLGPTGFTQYPKSWVKKGQRVHVTGRLSYGEITDASGQVKPTTAVIADDVIFFQK